MSEPPPPAAPVALFSAGTLDEHAHSDVIEIARDDHAVTMSSSSAKARWLIGTIAIGVVAAPTSFVFFGGTGLAVFLFAWLTVLALVAGGEPPGVTRERMRRTPRSVLLDLAAAEVRVEQEGERTLRAPLSERARVVERERGNIRVMVLKSPAIGEIPLFHIVAGSDDEEMRVHRERVLALLARFGVAMPDARRLRGK